MRRAAVGGLVVIALLVVACASGRIDEPALREAAHREETALLRRVRVFEDAALATYLTGMGRRLTGATLPFHVVRDPSLNAFAMPDGHVFVHTGLLAAVENEAQLAAILGHEIAHVVRRDALEARAPSRVEPITRDGTDSSLSRTASAILGLGLAHSGRAAIRGYGADREREADAAGLASVVRAGWDSTEAPAAFSRLAVQARQGGPREIFFFGNRARLGDRIETMRALLATTFIAAAAPNAVKNSEEFERLLRPVARENAAEDIRQGRFVLARRQLDRVLAATPADALAHLYDGDLHRLQSQRAAPGEAQVVQWERARAAYERAMSFDPQLADPHRQLGLLYYQQRDLAKARAAFQTYLALAPGAPDAKRIEDYVRGLER